jgi:hypothetical protein
VYGRDYGGKTLNFEASGGLTNASLVMQDKQTNSYWSLMKGQALAGELKGQALTELPIGEKITWKEWRAKYPNTKVLSVNSREDGRNPYQQYFRDQKGFRGLQAKDTRLKTKSPIFAFHHGDESFAIPYSEFESGASFALPDGSQVFLYREKDDEIFRSTAVFISKAGFVKKENMWIENQNNKSFDESSRSFGANVTRLSGFDTFWYNWSLNNPETQVLKAKK